MKKTLILTATIAAAGCGGSGERATPPPPPRLPPTLAQDFAQRADEIAQRLAAGDDCGALDAAKKLQQRSILRVGRVPAVYQETLQGAINDLVGRIHCTPPPPAAPPAAPAAPPAHDNGKHKGEKKHGEKHGEKHGKHDGDDD